MIAPNTKRLHILFSSAVFREAVKFTIRGTSTGCRDIKSCRGLALVFLSAFYERSYVSLSKVNVYDPLV